MDLGIRGPISGAAILSRRFWLQGALLLFLCLLPLLLYLPFLSTPFERDEGVYATIAQGLLDGKIPYRDLFDNKPPLVYGWYAFSFLLFGENVVAPRVVAALLLSMTTLTLFGQARMVFPRGAAYVATGLFALSTGLPYVAVHANTEAYMLLPLVASLTAFTIGMRRGDLRWFLLSGVLGGLAMMTKQVAVWNLLALAVVALIWRWRASGVGWRSIMPALCLLTGAAGTAFLVALPFAAMGALDDLIYANIAYNWLYAGAALSFAGLLKHLKAILFFLAVAAPLVGGAFGGLFLIWRRSRAWGPTAYLLSGWALGSVAGVATGLRFFPHYFLQLLPVVAILTAVVVYHGFRNWHMDLVGKTMIALGVVFVAISLVTSAGLYFVPESAERRFDEPLFYQEQWKSASQAVGAYIAERTGPEDAIFVFGREAQVYFYADRRPAVPYFYDWAYWYDESTLTETIEELRQTRPVYIIDSAQPPLFEDYERYHPPVFRQFLQENYEYVGKVYFADIYRVRERS